MLLLYFFRFKKKWNCGVEDVLKNSEIIEEDFQYYGGTAIITKYGTISKALESLFPEYNWYIWKFIQVP